MFIREQIDLYLQNQMEAQENEGNEAGEAEEEEEERNEEAAEDSGGTDDGEVEPGNGNNAAKRRSKKKNKDVKRRGGGGFSKLCRLSPELQKFTGVPELARTEVVKQLWSYIRENNLQDPTNRRNIVCDDILRDLFCVDIINMFQMNKALAKHIWPLDADCAPSAAAGSTSKEKKRSKEEVDDRKRKEKKQRGGSSGFLAPIPLSDALVKFLGTGESALPRSDVIKRMWDYIKQHDLQDPSDKRRILCDEKLKELFDVETFQGFTVSKLLTVHFLKEEK